MSFICNLKVRERCVGGEEGRVTVAIRELGPGEHCTLVQKRILFSVQIRESLPQQMSALEYEFSFPSGDARQVSSATLARSQASHGINFPWINQMVKSSFVPGFFLRIYQIRSPSLS